MGLAGCDVYQPAAPFGPFVLTVLSSTLKKVVIKLLKIQMNTKG